MTTPDAFLRTSLSSVGPAIVARPRADIAFG
jgi:hypothetical protein